MTVAKNCRIFVDGSDLACALKEIKFSQEMESVENTTLCTTGDKSFEPGLKKGTLPMSGIYDFNETTVDKIDNVLQGALSSGNDLVLTASLGAITLGGLAILAKGLNAKYEISSPLGQLIMASAEINTDSGILHGKWLFDGSATSAQASGTAQDNAASSNTGGVLNVHLYLKSDSTATDGSFILQHSSDGTTWADLVATFAIGGAKGAAQVIIPKGTTINRYLRIQFTAGGGKAYAASAFKRL